MYSKTLIMQIVFALVLIASFCWAVPPFKLVIENFRGNADSAREVSQNTEHLLSRMWKLADEISDISHGIDSKHQKANIQKVEEKVDKFQELVVELDTKTNILKGLADKMQKESSMLSKTQYTGQGTDRCGAGKIWIPGHTAANGKWVPGHCARQ